MAPNRSQTFSTPARQHLGENNDQAKLRQDKVGGPLSFFNPTRAGFDFASAKRHADADSPNAHNADSPNTHTAGKTPDLGGAHVRWRARDNRKGRHVLVVPKGHSGEGMPELTTGWSAISKGIWRMCVVWAYWDVSWWIAVLFSVGSLIFVLCGCFYWLPVAYPSQTFAGEGIAGGVTSAVGATLFTIGGLLLVVEASNDNQTGCFGWALEHALTRTHSDSDHENGSQPKKPSNGVVRPTECAHHHTKEVNGSKAFHMQHPDAGRRWEWWPTWHELRTHYFFELGFMASFVLCWGAVIFYISGLMALPWIYDACSQAVLYGVYWLAYLIGGILFVVSSALYMLETQPNWYTPAPSVLGWWIGTFNMIGSVGWTISASFGYCSAHFCVYQSNLTLIWASLAFLIGSMLLWYESLDKYPVISE